jgi:hypothetical protein
MLQCNMTRGASPTGGILPVMQAAVDFAVGKLEPGLPTVSAFPCRGRQSYLRAAAIPPHWGCPRDPAAPCHRPAPPWVRFEVASRSACATSAMIPTERLCGGAGGADDQQCRGISQSSPPKRMERHGLLAGATGACREHADLPYSPRRSRPLSVRLRRRTPQQRPASLIKTPARKMVGRVRQQENAWPGGMIPLADHTPRGSNNPWPLLP